MTNQNKLPKPRCVKSLSPQDIEEDFALDNYYVEDELCYRSHIIEKEKNDEVQRCLAVELPE